ncbi:MAG TPA: hypothetical protein PLT35_07940 [Vicinamibacterales bacterium]|nr:hypothetical protein [Vicinamibacterales bacterium]
MTEQQDIPVEAEPRDDSPAESPAPGRLVPVAESIRYRRRAQQAEARIHDLEQQFREVQAQLEDQRNQLALAEAQRDEARQQILFAENRIAAERALVESGVTDLEAASILLSKRVDLNEPLGADALGRHVEQLLLDKPYLRAAAGGLPPPTAAPKPRQAPAADLADAARRAAHSGNRRDVADYLRLRRQLATH